MNIRWAPGRDVLTVRVPVRICDLGGWTDTWFAGHGLVCHLAVWPGIDAEWRRIDGPPGVDLDVEAFGRRWRWTPGLDAAACPDPLLAAALDEHPPPPGNAFHVTLRSALPAGASMGTSAATCVAMLAASEALHGRVPDAATLAVRAHQVETVRLGWQSGVQDQFAACAGPVHLIAVGRYPHATCRQLPVPSSVCDRLDAGLLVAWLGRGHSSTAVHEEVVRALTGSGRDDPRLCDLRALARDGATALTDGDLDAYGACLTANTEVQRRLHPSLVSGDAQQVLSLAARYGARGCKVNGAGGDGGTVAVLCEDAAQRASLAAALAREAPRLRPLPVRLARGAPGVRVLVGDDDASA